MTKRGETPVIFRKWPESEGGDVIALFPTELGDPSPYTCSSYETVGQHGAADPVSVIQMTKAAKPSEYADLLAELRSLGYDDLKVVQRYQYSYLTERERKMREILGSTPARSATPKVKRGRKSGSRASRRGASPETSLGGIRR